MLILVEPIRLAAPLLLARLYQAKPFTPWDDPLDLRQKLFFFARTPESSSLSANRLICLFMAALCHFSLVAGYSVLCGSGLWELA